VDCVTFTSSSTVYHFLRHFSHRERQAVFKSAKAASIGPVTARTLGAYGIRAAIVPRQYTAEGLSQAIVRGLSA
jgi:uroporphyrinogen-III synthase